MACKDCGGVVEGKARNAFLCTPCGRARKLLQHEARRTIAQAKFWSFKQAQGCSVCGYNKCGRALDYHHLDPSTKDARIRALDWVAGRAVAMDEIAKCILVCKNCHHEIHHAHGGVDDEVAD